MDSDLRCFATRDLNNELVEAAANGDLNNVQHFLQIGANPHYITRMEDHLNIEDLMYRSTALMKAAHNGHLQTVITLLHHVKNSDYHNRFPTYWTVLIETLRNSVCRKPSHDLDSNSQGKLSREEIQNLNEFSLVSTHFKIMVYLIEQGVDINIELRNGMTPLMTATTSGSITSMQYFIDHGADVNLVLHSNGRGMNSALICAVKELDKDATSLLLKHGVNMDSFQARLAFFIAVSSGDMDIVKLLISYGARPTMIQMFDLYKVDIIDLGDISLYNERVSPLYQALYSNQPQIAKHFLGIGFITNFDITLLTKQTDLRCRLQTDESYSMVLDILNLIKREPMPLVLLCFLHILEPLSRNNQVVESVSTLNIPKGMKSRLLFGRI